MSPSSWLSLREPPHSLLPLAKLSRVPPHYGPSCVLASLNGYILQWLVPFSYSSTPRLLSTSIVVSCLTSDMSLLALGCFLSSFPTSSSQSPYFLAWSQCIGSLLGLLPFLSSPTSLAPSAFLWVWTWPPAKACMPTTN